MISLGRKIAVGTVWTVAARFFTRSMGVISMIILARLLIPEDFGIVALASATVAAFELMAAFSFDVILIQNQNTERKHYDTVWTFKIIFGLIIALSLVVFASPLAQFYDDDRLVYVFYALAFGNFLQGIENIGLVNFRKDLTFDKEFVFKLCIRLATFFVTVPLAYYLRSYWALVIGMVTGKIVGLMLSYYMHPYRPRLSLEAAREIFSMSTWLFLNNLILFARFRSSDFIIGKISGAASLGIFSISYEIAHLPSTELVEQVNRVLLPGFSKMNSSVTRLRDGYMKVAPLLNMIILPIGLGLAAVAEYLVPVILGDKWLDSIPLIVLLSIEGAIVASQRTVGVVLLAAGRAKTITYMAGVNIIVLIPTLIYATSKWGAIGTCWTLLVATCLMIAVNYGALYKYIGITFSDFLKIFLRPILASCVMYAGINFYAEKQPPSEVFFILFGQLIATVLLGIIIYTSTIIMLWLLSGRPEGPERIIIRQLKKILKRQSPLENR